MGFQSLLGVASIIIIVYAAILAQSRFFAVFSGRNLEYECHFSTDEAFEGEQVYIIETVSNRKKLPVLWLKAELNTSKWLDFAGPESTVTHNTRFVTSNFMLKGGQKITRKWPVKCLKRGSYSIEDVMLVWGDILGMGSSGLHVDVNANLIVYPATLNLREIGLPEDTLLGESIVKRWINEDPFITSGVRPYSSSDPLTRIHWASTARTGSLMSRKNDYTSEHKLFIVLNIQSTAYDIKEVLYEEMSEFSIKIASSLIDKALSKSVPTQLAVNGIIQEEAFLNGIISNDGMDKQHSKSLLYYLAKLELKVSENYTNFISKLNTQSNSNMLFITPYIDDSLLTAALSFKTRGINTSIVVSGNYDKKYINSGIDIFTVDENIEGVCHNAAKEG